MLIRPLVLAALASSLSVTLAAAGPPGGCPPGLAKKAAPCAPPGQARKWQIGEPLPRGADYIILDEVTWRGLGLRRPPDGTRYVMVDSQVLRVNQTTQEVLEAIAAVGRVLNP